MLKKFNGIFIGALVITHGALATPVTKLDPTEKKITATSTRESALIIDNNCTDITKIPEKWIKKAKKEFKLWYGHTSHGSQITNGMRAIKNGLYDFSHHNRAGALSIQEIRGDLGHNGNLTWFKKTQKQLNKNSDINLVMWSWCGGCSDNSKQGIETYLQAMTKLEKLYPKVSFIYMTGHLDGSGLDGNLNKRNEQIRQYCLKHQKILFDFAAIESFDPDGKSFLELRANDGCFYSTTPKGKRNKNWCDEWVAKHPKHGIAFPRYAAHTKALNGALKGRAFWWLLARLAGWSGK